MRELFAELKSVTEAEEIFKPATPEELKGRKEAARQAALKKGIREVDPEIEDLDLKYWRTHNALVQKLDQLPRGREECDCPDWDIFNELGYDQETTDVPGEDGYSIRRCLHCGGWISV